MPTSQDYVDFLIDQIDNRWNIRYRKMFGAYVLYVNNKPVLLICDNTTYVKKLEIIDDIIPEERTGFPFKKAKEHYIVDIENREELNSVIEELEKVIQIPKKKKKKKWLTTAST